MKITFLCASVSVGGGNRVIAQHALNLLSYGHDVTVVSRKRSAWWTAKHHLRRLLGMPIKPINPDRTVYFDPLGKRHRMIVGPVEPHHLPDADVVIATFWSTAEEVASMPPEKGAKAYLVQGHEVHGHLPAERSAATYRLPMKKIVVSKWLADIMAKSYGDPDTALVPNAVDLKHFETPPRGRQAEPTVGFVYAGGPYKGTDTLLAALDRVRDSFPGMRVVAFGMTGEKEMLPLPPGTEYRKLPLQDEIPGLYASCDVWVMASRSEGFGLPLLEAMACRTPVISTRTGAAEDLIEDGVNGYVVDVDDDAALADRIGRILKLPDAEWQAMSEAAHTRAHAWDWEAASRAFEAALFEIAGKKARSG